MENSSGSNCTVHYFSNDHIFNTKQLEETECFDIF